MGPNGTNTQDKVMKAVKDERKLTPTEGESKDARRGQENCYEVLQGKVCCIDKGLDIVAEQGKDPDIMINDRLRLAEIVD